MKLSEYVKYKLLDMDYTKWDDYECNEEINKLTSSYGSWRRDKLGTILQVGQTVVFAKGAAATAGSLKMGIIESIANKSCLIKCTEGIYTDRTVRAHHMNICVITGLI